MSTNKLAGVGAGKNRRPYMIREFLAINGFTMCSVAKEVGVSPTLVRETVYGVKNNKRVLSCLHGLGCPKEYLSMPEVKN